MLHNLGLRNWIRTQDIVWRIRKKKHWSVYHLTTKNKVSLMKRQFLIKKVRFRFCRSIKQMSNRVPKMLIKASIKRSRRVIFSMRNQWTTSSTVTSKLKVKKVNLSKKQSQVAKPTSTIVIQILTWAVRLFFELAQENYRWRELSYRKYWWVEEVGISFNSSWEEDWSTDEKISMPKSDKARCLKWP